MKKRSVLQSYVLIGIALITLIINACSNSYKEEAEQVKSNIEKYTYVWDEIMNKGKLDMFNDSNFTKDVVMHSSPSDVIGIDSARAYYTNFLTGFSNIQFTIEDVFGQGDKLVKHWRFKGTHTGNFFGIPPTGKTVDIDGTTLVRMSNGKIAEEKDFYDNYEFLNQLGLIPQSKQ
jgi:steroid delta-isomerase-like uncharacterized protein